MAHRPLGSYGVGVGIPWLLCYFTYTIALLGSISHINCKMPAAADTKLWDCATGFLDGWANDEKCVARQTGLGGVPLPAAQVKHAQTTAELKDMVINGVVSLIC